VGHLQRWASLLEHDYTCAGFTSVIGERQHQLVIANPAIADN
jgi:hypothetical protein